MIVLASAKPGEFCGTSWLAEATGSPRNYLGKLLLLLSRRGLVESQKGLRGGFRLARDPGAISLFDVIASIEDVARWKECAFGGKACSDATPCPVHERWGHVRDAYMTFLSDTSVAQLVTNGGVRNTVEGLAAPAKALFNTTPQRRPQ
jgi:Rrf2 family protein